MIAKLLLFAIRLGLPLIPGIAALSGAERPPNVRESEGGGGGGIVLHPSLFIVICYGEQGFVLFFVTKVVFVSLSKAHTNPDT